MGIGTLYRRFPDRDDLLAAVALDIHQGLADAARTAWDDEPDAWSALRRFLRHWAKVRLGMPYRELCGRQPHLLEAYPELRKTRTVWLGLLEQMVEGAKSEERMRPDIATGDLIVLMNLLVRQLELPGELGEEIPGRFLDLMLDELSAVGRTELSGTPITLDALGL